MFKHGDSLREGMFGPRWPVAAQRQRSCRQLGLEKGLGVGRPGLGVTLHDGGELQLELSGDLGERNAGMLIFAGGRERPEYVPWADVAQVELDRPQAMYPPLGT